MSNYLFISLGALVIALLSGSFFTALAIRLAPRFGLLDCPKSESHKNHGNATPVAGGSAIWLAIGLTALLSLVCVACLPSHHREILIHGIASTWRIWFTALVCATALTAMGLKDDHSHMAAKTKFWFQMAVAFLTAILCPRILSGYLHPLIAIILTTLWVATVINATNFLDNMDGLAGGTSAIAFLYLSIVSTMNGQYLVTAFNCTVLGALLGFLIYNRPPARIFMGDSGSHLLGYLLALSSIMTSYYHPATSPTLTPILTPIIILAIPLLDAVTVVIIRLYLHKPVYVGDNRHISHRFTQLGMTRPQAVYAVWLLSFITGAGALVLRYLPSFGAALVIAQILALMALVLLIQFCARSSTH